MRLELELQEPNLNLYIPERAQIKKVKSFTDKEKFFQLELESGRDFSHDPGQFVQLSIPGIGEAPVSVSSPPAKSSQFEICLRAMGDVTNKLHTLQVGDTVYIRGPFGHGFDEEILQKLKGKHLLLIAGGIGYIPIRSLINKVIPERNHYDQISILYGCKTPEERMFPEELADIAKVGANVSILETVDQGNDAWKSNVGVITTLIPKVDFKPTNTIAIIVGPPIMYKFVLMELMKREMQSENIYMSLERRMRCGIGKCGHCQMEGIYVCQEGPVFCYADVENNEEVF